MLAYLDTGKGTPIVFIHGLGSTKESWAFQYELSLKYRMIIPDLRGHGETELEDDITMENFAKDILELLDHLGIESAYICGLSLGGLVAQELYKQRPEAVRGLILANTAAYVSAILAYPLVSAAYEHYRDEDFASVVASKGLHDQSLLKFATDTFHIRDCYMSAVVAPLEHNYFCILLEIDKPVLLISGLYDIVTPSVNQLFMKVAAKNARREMLESGHLSNIECHAEFNRLVDQFIEEG